MIRLLLIKKIKSSFINRGGGKKMNARKRFKKVINGEIPDRVPVTLFIQDQGHFINQVYPEVDPWDYLTLQKKVVEFQKQLGVDVFVRMLFYEDIPLTHYFGGLDISQETENWKVETKEIKSGKTLIKRSTINTPDGELTQDFSINKPREGTFMYACTKKPIKNPKDLEIVMKYEPGFPISKKKNMIKSIKEIKNVLGNSGILGVWVPGGPFNYISTLVPLDDIYSVFLYDNDFYKRLMNFAIKKITPYTEIVKEAGPDVICLGGNVAGGFMGKKIYEEHILDFEKHYIDICQNSGIPAMYHNCGEIMNLVSSYKKLGCKLVEPFSPPPILGDADLVKAIEIIDGEYAIIGGVDQVNILKEGTIDQVKKVTKKTIKTGKPGGKFILQSADFLEYGTPIENLKAYVKTAVENAWY